MGAALSTSRYDPSSANWPLLGEFVAHSIHSLTECAGIFLGNSPVDLSSYDDEESNNPPRQRKGFPPAAGWSDTKPPLSYPRHLNPTQFDEVFGMLVPDAEPHFGFFANGSSGVCAHQVFCSLALLAQADLHAKVLFILRLYATDDHGQLLLDRRLQLLRDFLTVLPRVLSLVEPVDLEVISYLEKLLLVDEEGGTTRAFYDICFTTARVSGYLHEIQVVVDEITRLKGTDEPLHKRTKAAMGNLPANGAVFGESGRLKLLNRGATMLQLTVESPLWSRQARDLPWFWRQQHVLLPSDTTVRQALLAMKHQGNASEVLVVGSNPADYRGLLSLDNFHSFFVDLLPTDVPSSAAMGDYMRLQIAKDCYKFGDSTLASVLAHVDRSTTRGAGSRSSLVIPFTRYHCVSGDECLFNTILRLACGVWAVAVLSHDACSLHRQTHGDAAFDPLLGCISALDVLEWLLEDLSLLNGKERYAVASFPSFYNIPVTVAVTATGASTNKHTSVLDALVAMQTHRVTGVLLAASPDTGAALSVLSTQCIHEVFSAQEQDNSANNGANRWRLHPVPLSGGSDVFTSLLSLDGELHHASAPCQLVTGDHSIAHVIHTMVRHRTRRVYISDSDSKVVGVVRATDILQLLLQEQHRKSRTV